MKTDRHRLSKSRYIRGLQCVKALYLDTFHSDLARLSDATRQKFVEGRRFESVFKGLFPSGIDVSKRVGPRFGRYPEVTSELLANPGECVLFEAGFVYDDVLVLADVLHRKEDGTVCIYEVKNTSKVSPVIRNDVYLQHYVISHCLDNISSFEVVHRNESYTVDMPQKQLFLKEDLTREAIEHKEFVASHIAEFKDVLAGFEPQVEMGEHCNAPYECPYQEYCKGVMSIQINLQDIW